MAKRNKKPPPRAYHDGLIPATHDTYQSYPEVVPDDHDQVKHEKSYPELAPPQDSNIEQQQQQQQSQRQPTAEDYQSITLPPPSANSAHHPHQNQLSSSGTVGPSPLTGPPPVIPALHPLPRTSGVHSLRQAWSELDDTDGEDAARRGSLRGHHNYFDGDRPAIWRRPVFWVVLVATAIIAALAGILGGVASGRITTAFGSSNSNSASPTPSVADPKCPGANNLNYTSGAAPTPKTFRVQCGSNYPNGDGELGRLGDAVDSIADCLDACASEQKCVGAVFAPGTPATCWLKEFIGVVEKGGEAKGMVSGVLWQ
ncbi:hypothetical protein VTI28DRAFT_7621 [Corynascus sepedonium]